MHYDELLRIKPSPIVALNRAVAIANLRGAEAGLDQLEAIGELDSHYLLHAVRGELQMRLQQDEAAAESFRHALELCRVGPEQHHLKRMLEGATSRCRRSLPQ